MTKSEEEQKSLLTPTELQGPPDFLPSELLQELKQQQTRKTCLESEVITKGKQPSSSLSRWTQPSPKKDDDVSEV